MNPSQLIDKQIASYTDWRGEMMAQLRKIIHEADPEIKEEWKWETGVWTDNGMVCAVGHRVLGPVREKPARVENPPTDLIHEGPPPYPCLNPIVVPTGIRLVTVRATLRAKIPMRNTSGI